MRLAVVFLMAIVIFASVSAIATVATSFNISTANRVWKYIRSDNLSLDINGTTPCRPIDDDGGP